MPRKPHMLREEQEEEKEEDLDDLQDSKEPERDDDDRDDDDTNDDGQIIYRLPPVPAGDEIAAEEPFGKAHEDMQEIIMGGRQLNTGVTLDRSELRRRLREPTGREGRILKKMKEVKPGQARRRLRKGMRSMELGFPDRPDSIAAFSDINELTQPVTDPIPPPLPPVDFDDPNLPLTDEEDRR